MSSYFPMTDFKATVRALTGDNDTTVPLPDGGFPNIISDFTYFSIILHIIHKNFNYFSPN